MIISRFASASPATVLVPSGAGRYVGSRSIIRTLTKKDMWLDSRADGRRNRPCEIEGCSIVSCCVRSWSATWPAACCGEVQSSF